MEAVRISSDDLIEAYGAANGLNYSEAWNAVSFKSIEKQMWQLFDEATARGDRIIVDRTNMTKKSRKAFFDRAPKTYEFHSVVFQLEDAVLAERLRIREETTGKSIPPFVVRNMKANYEEPVLSEGFRTISLHRDVPRS
jgi:tRNA uridine 5-carbamoylmethylation protein Kti12